MDNPTKYERPDVRRSGLAALAERPDAAGVISHGVQGDATSPAIPDDPDEIIDIVRYGCSFCGANMTVRIPRGLDEEKMNLECIVCKHFTLTLLK